VRSETLLSCDEVSRQLAEAVDGPLSLDPDARRHVETCLGCQAEAAGDRRLRRALRGLRHELSEPVPGLLDDVLAALGTGADRRSGRLALHRRRAAYVGGIAAATAAGVGGAVVLAGRTRRRLPLAG